MSARKTTRRRKPHKGQFKKGTPKPPNSGRKKGTPNLQTSETKANIEGAYAARGGLDRLLKWIDKSDLNETIFYSQMWMRLLPIQMQGVVTTSMTMRITSEELVKRLEERGLPPMLPKLTDDRIIDAEVVEDEKNE
jgi:hypothetical protein